MKTITLQKMRDSKGWLPIGARYTYSYKTADERKGLERARAALIRDTRDGEAPEDPIADWQVVPTRDTDLRHSDRRRIAITIPEEQEVAA